MKDDDLWQDTLGDAVPDDLAASTLAAMRREHLRAKQRRRFTGAAVGVMACALTALLLRPAPETPRMAVAAPPSSASIITVRSITDDELLAHFPDVGVALAGPPEDRRLLIVFADGEVFQP